MSTQGGGTGIPLSLWKTVLSAFALPMLILKHQRCMSLNKFPTRVLDFRVCLNLSMLAWIRRFFWVAAVINDINGISDDFLNQSLTWCQIVMLSQRLEQSKRMPSYKGWLGILKTEPELKMLSSFAITNLLSSSSSRMLRRKNLLSVVPQEIILSRRERVRRYRGK